MPRRAIPAALLVVLRRLHCFRRIAAGRYEAIVRSLGLREQPRGTQAEQAASSSESGNQKKFEIKTADFARDRNVDTGKSRKFGREAEAAEGAGSDRAFFPAMLPADAKGLMINPAVVSTATRAASARYPSR